MSIRNSQVIRFFIYILFWMCFFWLSKVLFLVWNFNLTSRLSAGEILGIFGHGLKMDISTAGYLLLLPGLFLSFRAFVSSKIINRFIWIYTILFLGTAAILSVLDLGLYPHWGTRVNVTVFNYINDPVAIQASVSVPDAIWALLLASALVAGFVFLYKKWLPDGLAIERKPKWYSVPWRLFLVATLIIPIRGGFDVSPLNLSSVAFSPKLYVNQAASNYLWNFTKSVEKRKKFTNPCLYMDQETSLKLFEEGMQKDTVTSRPQLIKLNEGKLPNVVLVILESFSNKVIASLGGLNGIAPNLDSLCSKSTVFTNFYASGNRSDRGISAILGSYPSLLSTSIMVYPEKSRSLTLLPEYFNRRNYHTSFYYGGDINFYNLKTFILQGNYSRLVSKPDFPAELGRMTKWGVPDGYVFEKALADMKTEKQPYMMTIYTTSSHPPFDVPYSKIKGQSVDDKYLNSVAYTDSCLGQFIHGLQELPEWDNTLLLVTSDHGTMSPGPTDINAPASYRIPLVWSGGVVDSLQRIETITMQSDLTVSLVHQLGWESDSTRFAKDFFTAKPFAFYMLDSGWGYLVPEGEYYFDQNTGDFTKKPENHEKFQPDFAKAFMQVLHEDFIRR